eukprot:2526328-Pyramimonas_sp.AAC.1
MPPKRRLRSKTRDDDLHMPRSLSQTMVAAGLGVTTCTYRAMRRIGMPTLVYSVMFEVVRSSLFASVVGTLECVEYFSGVGRISSTFSGAGFPSLGYDILNDSVNHDLCSAQGFLYALIIMMRLSPDGLAWFATVCSSWIWLSSNSTGRSRSRPLGSSSSASARQGNIQVARSAILLALCHAKRAWWGLEQPLKSLMVHHPAMKWIAERVDWVEVSTVMGAFGACSLKPSSLYGNSEWVRGLYRRRPPGFKPSNTDTVMYE